MKTKTIMALSLLLAGCGLYGPTSPEAVKATSSEELCDWWGKFENQAALNEVDSRKALTALEHEGATNHLVFVGMTPLAVVCAWGRPTEVHKTYLTAGHPPHEQWVYQRYHGQILGTSFAFVYVDDGLVSAIQH